jgi:hypothetical protein
MFAGKIHHCIGEPLSGIEFEGKDASDSSFAILHMSHPPSFNTKIPGQDPGFYTLHIQGRDRYYPHKALTGSCRSCRAHHTTFSALDALYRFFLLDSPALSFGEVVVVPA